MQRWLAVLAALALAGPASAANVATPQMHAVASWAAGKPLTVWCESDPAEWNRLVAQSGLTHEPGSSVAGFTLFAAPTIYLRYDRCPMLAGPEHWGFGLGLNTLLHEAYHQRGGGVRDEALVECAALVLQYEAMRRFYGVPFFSPTMTRHADVAIAHSRTLPARFQNGCP